MDSSSTALWHSLYQRGKVPSGDNTSETQKLKIARKNNVQFLQARFSSSLKHFRYILIISIQALRNTVLEESLLVCS